MKQNKNKHKRSSLKVYSRGGDNSSCLIKWQKKTLNIIKNKNSNCIKVDVKN